MVGFVDATESGSQINRPIPIPIHNPQDLHEKEFIVIEDSEDNDEYEPRMPSPEELDSTSKYVPSPLPHFILLIITAHKKKWRSDK